MFTENFFTNKKIALVGNSTILFSQNYGKIIDQHDLVCRINKGPLVCNVETHGVKTNVLFYSDSKIILPEIPKLLLDDVLYVLAQVRYENAEQPVGKLHKLPKEWLNRTNQICGYNEKKKWPSTGLYSLLFLLEQRPIVVSLFGFDWKKNPTFYRLDEKESKRHKYAMEEAIIRNLKKVKIYE